MSQDVGEGSSPDEKAEDYRAILDVVENAACRLDADHRIAAANEALLNQTVRDDIVGSPCETLVANENRGRFLAAVETARAGADEVETVCVSLKSGTSAEARIRALPTGGTIVVLDEDDSDNEQQFRTLVDAVEDYAIFRLDADGYVTSWNEGAARIKGYEESEIVGKHFSAFYTEADREAGIPEQNLKAAAECGRIEEEGMRVRKDGTRFEAHVVINAIYEDGEVVGYAKVTRDISEQRERERRLGRERNLTDQVFETSPVAVFVFDDEATLERANSRACEMLGAEELDDGDLPLAEENFDIEVYAEDGDRLDPEDHPVNQVIRTGDPISEQQIALEQPDGSRIWLLVNATPITDANDEVERVVVTAEDVTSIEERVESLERVRKGLQTELDEVFDRVTAAFYALDDEWRFRYINDRAEELLNPTEEDLIGQTLWEALPGTVDSQIEDSFRQAMAEQTPIQFEEYYGPLESWFEIHVYPSESGLSVYFQDVTKRKEREESLASLHDINQQFPHAETKAEIADLLVETATEVFGLAGVAVCLHDSETDTLSPIATGGELAESYQNLPTVEATADSVLGETFVSGETNVYEDLAPYAEDLCDSSHLRRGLFVPLGDHGVLLAGDMDVGGFADRIVELAELLAANATAALDRIEREAELRKRERDLERYEAIIETIDDGVYVLDENSEFLAVNQAYSQITGYDPDDLIGTVSSRLLTEEGFAEAERAHQQMVEGETEVHVLETDIITADGDRVPTETRMTLFPTGDGEYGRVGVVRDVTERKRREAELERIERQFEATFNNPVSFMGLLDPDGSVRQVNETALEFADATHEEITGEKFWETPWFDHSTELQKRLQKAVNRAADGEYVRSELEHESDTGEIAVIDSMLEPVHDDGEVVAVLASGRDVTERKERERALRDAYEIIADPDLAFDERVAALLEEVRDTVGTTFATFSCVHDDEYIFEAVDAPDDVDLTAGDSVPLSELPNCERVVETEQTLVLEDVSAQAPGLSDSTWGIESYLGAPVAVDDEVYGTFCFYEMDSREEEFSDWKVTFVELLSNWVGYELTRRQHADRLAALNDLNEVVRDVNEAIVSESTRDKIERQVCQRLAESNSYEFAWIGEVDRGTNEVSVRAEAGVDGYLDNTTITVSDEGSHGPTGRAFRTQELQVARGLPSNPDYEPWSDAAAEFGFRSSAAIPITYDDTIYGVLNVYSSRTDGFTDEEQTVVRQLGEIIGHAINAIERKEALMSDEVVEVEFQLPGIVADLASDVDADGQITLDRAVQLDEGGFLEYGTATAGGVDILEALVDVLPHWVEVSYLGDPEDVGPVRFELALSDPPVLTTVAEHGGRVRSAVIEDGDYEMTVEIPPNADIRSLVETVQDEYPNVELVAQRRTTRPDRAPERTLASLTEELTDRQRSAIEAAYFAGYFEWPRESSGEDIAESLDVSSPTFHQHLRSAQRKMVGSVFDDPVDDAR